jgi:hypothetical protein
LNALRRPEMGGSASGVNSGVYRIALPPKALALKPL